MTTLPSNVPDTLKHYPGFEWHDGIYRSPQPLEDQAGYQALWEQEAAEDAIYSATGVRSRSDRTFDQHTFEELTVSRQAVWMNFPSGDHGVILEIGCGYGRVPLLLSRLRQVRCERYIGVDLSLGMLQRFVQLRDRFDLFSGSTFELFHTSADRLPVESTSVDLVISSGVFLHMGKRFARHALSEIARTLKPGGRIVLDSSFPNALAIAALPTRLFGAFAKAKANRAKYYTRREIHALMVETGIRQKCGQVDIVPQSLGLLPGSFRGARIPLAGAINRQVQGAGAWLAPWVAQMYSVNAPPQSPAFALRAKGSTDSAM